jgi:RHS repeat-associated protein
VGRHSYFPFGEEVTSPGQNQERMKFTGHERDLGGDGLEDDLDYMHARYCSPLAGRFLSVDPVLQLDTAPGKPQLWNRYTYVVNNPMLFSDPTGEDVSIQLIFSSSFDESTRDDIIGRVEAFWKSLGVGKVYVFDANRSNETNLALVKRGVARIGVSTANGNSDPGMVRAGQFVGESGLSASQVAQGVANAINHEIFAHQFSLSPFSKGDLNTFSINRRGNVVPEVAERYGTIADSRAASDPTTRPAFLNGSLPVHPADLETARRRLLGVSLSPPSEGANQFWRFW